jgi:hypothetical protein
MQNKIHLFYSAKMNNPAEKSHKLFNKLPNIREDITAIVCSYVFSGIIMQSSKFLNNFATYSLLLTIMLLGLSACNGKTDNNTDNQTTDTPSKVVTPDASKTQVNTPVETPITPKETEAFSWLKLSGWHTQGTISRKTPIRIVFNRDVVNDDLIGKDASKIMHIAPAIDGKPKFKSKTEIVWIPAKQLQAGTEYKVSISPKGLKDVPTDVVPLKFSFHVIPLEFEIKTFGLTTAPNKPSEMLLKGQLLVSDRVNPNDVESVIKATLQDKKLPIEWWHDDNGKKHSFVINKIARESFATDIKLVWDGKPIKINTQGNQEIAVPSIDDFKSRYFNSVYTNSFERDF